MQSQSLFRKHKIDILDRLVIIENVCFTMKFPVQETLYPAVAVDTTPSSSYPREELRACPPPPRNDLSRQIWMAEMSRRSGNEKRCHDNVFLPDLASSGEGSGNGHVLVRFRTRQRQAPYLPYLTPPGHHDDDMSSNRLSGRLKPRKTATYLEDDPLPFYQGNFLTMTL